MIQSLHTMWDCETVFGLFFFLETVNPAHERYTSGENWLANVGKGKLYNWPPLHDMM